MSPAEEVEQSGGVVPHCQTEVQQESRNENSFWPAVGSPRAARRECPRVRGAVVCAEPADITLLRRASVLPCETMPLYPDRSAARTAPNVPYRAYFACAWTMHRDASIRLSDFGCVAITNPAGQRLQGRHRALNMKAHSGQAHSSRRTLRPDQWRPVTTGAGKGSWGVSWRPDPGLVRVSLVGGCHVHDLRQPFSLPPMAWSLLRLSP